MGNSGKMSLVYFGRFLAGIGIGETVVVGPVYLSEIAPAPIRGLCTCAFTGSVYLGILIAYFANYGTNINPDITDSPARWLLPTSVHLMFGVVILVASLWAIESPRYLVKAGKPEQALANLASFAAWNPPTPTLPKSSLALSVPSRKSKRRLPAWAGREWSARSSASSATHTVCSSPTSHSFSPAGLADLPSPSTPTICSRLLVSLAKTHLSSAQLSSVLSSSSLPSSARCSSLILLVASAP